MNGSLPEGTEVICSMYKVSMYVDRNALLPKYVTFGKLTVDNDLQPWNALLPTYEHNGRSMDFNNLQK